VVERGGHQTGGNASAFDWPRHERVRHDHDAVGKAIVCNAQLALDGGFESLALGVVLDELGVVLDGVRHRDTVLFQIGALCRNSLSPRRKGARGPRIHRLEEQALRPVRSCAASSA
jgi:hypothetical protein